MPDLCRTHEGADSYARVHLYARADAFTQLDADPCALGDAHGHARADRDCTANCNIGAHNSAHARPNRDLIADGNQRPHEHSNPSSTSELTARKLRQSVLAAGLCRSVALGCWLPRMVILAEAPGCGPCGARELNR
jgi:hypothetical protein